jgi:putative ABC transport system permease protein
MTELRQIVRRLSQSLGFTVTVILTLAIGIGGTTAIFSVINGILIKPLPYAESERLVALQLRSREGQTINASDAIYFTYRDNNRTFDSVALYSLFTNTVTGSGDPEQVWSVETTYEFLPTLGVKPLLGRAFSAADDLPGSPKTVVLSYAYWQRHFGGAEDVLGKNLMVDGEPHSVIGVLPQAFRTPLTQQPAILVPMQIDRARTTIGSFGPNGVARLKSGATLEEASADVARMLPIAIDTYPPVGVGRESFDNYYSPNLRPLKDVVVGDLSEVLWVLMGTLGMLLLIACANVANLQLVRTETRARELAIRAALGAGWAALARGLLLESALLGLAGGAIGLAMAWLALPVLLSASAGQLPAVLDVTIDRTVVIFTLAISLASGFLFGLIPVVKHAAPVVATAMSGSGLWRTAGRERVRARSSLVVVQVALALTLLVASGLMIRTFEALRHVAPGFTAPEQVQAVSISIPERVVPDYDRALRMHNDIQDRLSAIAGVKSVGFVSAGLPLAGGATGAFFIEDKPLPADQVGPQRAWRIASPNYFETLGTPLVAGRTFEWRDNYDARAVAVVSENMARSEWGSPSAALGKRIRLNPVFPWLEIVGVVGDIHHDGLDRPAPTSVYLALNDPFVRLNDIGRYVSFVIRSERVGTTGFLDDVQAAVWSVNGNLPLAAVQTLGDLYQRSMARASLTLVLLATTAAMALLLGLVGIYGVVSYTLSQRTREIGIRMALGAQTAQLKGMLLRQVLLLALIGIALGLGGAAGLTQLMRSLLFGVTALDPVTYVVTAAVLFVTAALAGWVPTQRVTRIEPMRALREE